MANIQADKETAIADEGIAYATKLLMKNWPNWQNITGITECTNVDLTSADGNHFHLQCGVDPTLFGGFAVQPYQLAVIATAYKAGPGGLVPGRARLAYLSPKTLAAYLPTGTSASAALYLANPPAGALNVNWGPIVLNTTATTPWHVTDFVGPAGGAPPSWPATMDSGQYPRKFSQSQIYGDAVLRASGNPPPVPPASWPTITDQKEYWAYASIGFPGQIDILSPTGYKSLAAAETTGVTQTGGTTCCNTGTGCGCFTGAAQITGGALGPGDILYVEGDAQLDNLNVDMPLGAIIVTHNLILGNALTPINHTDVHVPNTAHYEYPVLPLKNTWYQKINEGQMVTTFNTNIHTFIYVGNNLTVNGNWSVVGAIAVDGNVNVSAGAGLAVWYDDNVNRNIKVGDPQLQVDFLRDIATQ